MYDFYYSKVEFEYQKKEFNNGSKIHIHRVFFKGKEYTQAKMHKTPFDGFPTDSVYVGSGDIFMDITLESY